MKCAGKHWSCQSLLLDRRAWRLLCHLCKLWCHALTLFFFSKQGISWASSSIKPIQRQNIFYIALNSFAPQEFSDKGAMNPLQHRSPWVEGGLWEVGRNPPETPSVVCSGCRCFSEGVVKYQVWISMVWIALQFYLSCSFSGKISILFVICEGLGHCNALRDTAQQQRWWNHELLFINWVIPHVESLDVYKTAWVGWSKERGLSFGLIPVNWWEWKKNPNKSNRN